LTEQEKVIKTFLALLSFSAILNSPKERKHIRNKDIILLEQLGKLKYSEIAEGEYFELLMGMKEKYL
jgi:hypothetical protein